MKHRTLINRITAVVFGLLMIAAGAFGAFAEVEVPNVTEEPIATVPVTETPVWTDPPTDPPTEAPTQATTQPTTQPYQETTETHTENGGFIDNNNNHPATEFVPPTIPKTISEKSYTTNVAAGVVSWVCVIVGIVVIFAVIVSTKLSDYRAGRRV